MAFVPTRFRAASSASPIKPFRFLKSRVRRPAVCRTMFVKNVPLLHLAFRHRPDRRLELHAAGIASHRGKNRRRLAGGNGFQRRARPSATRGSGIPDAKITTRILWLEGLEPGFNRGGNVDSHARYIYIHGTADQTSIGQPASCGCIHLADADLIPLFDLLPGGTLVWISEREPPARGDAWFFELRSAIEMRLPEWSHRRKFVRASLPRLLQ